MPLLWGVFYTEPQQRWMGSLAAGGPPTMAHLSSPLDHGMSPFGRFCCKTRWQATGAQ